MKLVCLVIMITELVMMIWEVTKNKDLRKLEIPGFEKLSEEERRLQNHKRMTCLGFISMGIFILMLVLAGILGKGRECGERQALENAVCKECWDSNCQACPIISKTC